MFLKDMKNAVRLLKYVYIVLSYQNLKSVYKLGGSEDVHLQFRRGYCILYFAFANWDGFQFFSIVKIFVKFAFTNDMITAKKCMELWLNNSLESLIFMIMWNIFYPGHHRERWYD